MSLTARGGSSPLSDTEILCSLMVSSGVVCSGEPGTAASSRSGSGRPPGFLRCTELRYGDLGGVECSGFRAPSRHVGGTSDSSRETLGHRDVFVARCGTKCDGFMSGPTHSGVRGQAALGRCRTAMRSPGLECDRGLVPRERQVVGLRFR